jgi:hypothetical protein
VTRESSVRQSVTRFQDFCKPGIRQNVLDPLPCWLRHCSHDSPDAFRHISAGKAAKI